MKLTMVKNDNGSVSIYIDGEMYDWHKAPDSVPSTVYAVQAHPKHTEIENFDLTNKIFSDPPSYVEDIVETWKLAKKAYEAELAAFKELNADTDLDG